MIRTSVYTILFFEIVGDDTSPYNQMVQKLYDIERIYFDKTPRWAEQRPDEVDFLIKDAALKDFDILADETLNKELKDRLSCILHEGRNEVHDYDWSMKSLEFVKQSSREHFGQIKPCPQIDEAFLQRLYKKALGAISQDGDGQGKIGFNKGFHHALLHNTIWACKELVERRTIQFIEEVVTKTVADILNNNNS